jgi:membrane protease YdiL (CAAX protease family)
MFLTNVKIKRDNHMVLKNGLRVFIGPLLLLAISYVIYVVRYPMWSITSPVELPYIGMFLTYFAVFVVTLVLIKKDMKAKLTDIFKFKDTPVVLLGLLLAVLLNVLTFGFTILLGGKMDPISFASGTLSSLPFAFTIYFLYGTFCSFAEEVTYRAYAESIISSKYGFAVGIFASTMFFSLQHIHVFQVSWLEWFFSTQFIHVLLFGIVTGYFFMKSKGNLWAVVAFHVLVNIIVLALPIQGLPAQGSAQSILMYWIVNILSFTVLMVVLRILPFDKLMKTRKIEADIL